jgi:hypothetical protein
MRNNNRNIIISSLVKRSESKKKGLPAPGSYLYRTMSHELREAELEEFRVKQVQKERKGGQWVEVRRGIRIFVHDGEDKETKVRRYQEKLQAIEKANAPVKGTCRVKTFAPVDYDKECDKVLDSIRGLQEAESLAACFPETFHEVEVLFDSRKNPPDHKDSTNNPSHI